MRNNFEENEVFQGRRGGKIEVFNTCGIVALWVSDGIREAEMRNLHHYPASPQYHKRPPVQ